MKGKWKNGGTTALFTNLYCLSGDLYQALAACLLVCKLLVLKQFRKMEAIIIGASLKTSNPHCSLLIHCASLTLCTIANLVPAQHINLTITSLFFFFLFKSSPLFPPSLSPSFLLYINPGTSIFISTFNHFFPSSLKETRKPISPNINGFSKKH